MRRYWQILRKYKFSLIMCPILVLITVICETIQPRFMSVIVDEGIAPRDINVVNRIGIYMILVSILGLASSIANIYLSSRTSTRFGTDLRGELFAKIQQLSFSDIDRFSPASLITRLTNDISKIQQIVLMSLRLLLRSPLMMIMALFFITTIDGHLALILLAVIPIVGITIYFLLKKGLPLFIIVQKKVDQLNAVVRENLINIKVVKSFVREDYESGKFVKSSNELRDMVIRASNLMIILFPVMQLVLNLSILFILWVGGEKVIGGDLMVGELISLVNYMMQILMSLTMLSMIIMNFARAAASSERILDVLRTQPSLTNTPEGLEDKYKITQGSVEFRKVYFRYQDGEYDALRNISFNVNPGESVAVVGATGSAKTTMVQLIPRLYDVTGGEILIDGIDVRRYNIEELRYEIGVVLQKNDLFSGTILENLRWGDENATMEEIQAAAKAAQAHDFIMSFENGYNTMLERGGGNLSGGQKQRLCIARAILRNPKILILDDSTSAVDTDTEQKIRKGLEEILKNTTVFTITQRINTMQNADKVIILEDGEINAIGTPQELLETSTTYQEIYNSQQMDF